MGHLPLLFPGYQQGAGLGVVAGTRTKAHTGGRHRKLVPNWGCSREVGVQPLGRIISEVSSMLLRMVSVRICSSSGVINGRRKLSAT